jgi:hypothetical protein
VFLVEETGKKNFDPLEEKKIDNFSLNLTFMITFLTLRQFICPLSLFLKEIPFASLTNAIDVKIERVLTGFLIG